MVGYYLTCGTITYMFLGILKEAVKEEDFESLKTNQ